MIIRTKLAPPRPQKYTLPRPRLTHRLLEARQHRLVILQAGTGYGKSTALAALAEQPFPVMWYRLDGEDVDPQRFLEHLVMGITAVLPITSEAPLALLEEWSQNRSISWAAVVDTLINECVRCIDEDLYLVLDDVHHLHDTTDTIRILDRFIALSPPTLHIILATRYPIPLPSLLTWRVKGEVLEIPQEELAFSPAEIDALFRTRYNHPLTLEQATLLINKLEGWPIALHLIWKHLQRDGGAVLADVLVRLSGSTGELFAYLTQEVLAQQPEDIQTFLRITAVLRHMTPTLCDHLRDSRDSKEILRYLLENGLFIVEMGDGQLRYHRLFRELLLQQLPLLETHIIHHKAAHYYRQQHNNEEALYHLLTTEAYPEAAKLLGELGRDMIRAGRLDTLTGWIGLLPPDVLAATPVLLIYLGDVARLHSRFEQALGWYQQAEQRNRTLGDLRGVGQALRGQARVYLDTVNPNPAEQLLQEALRLADGQEDRESRARLLELLAENLLNQGRITDAQKYQTQAHELRQEAPNEAELPIRILLRTGRLAEARRRLEKQIELEQREPVLRPRAHRETLLLLSLILAFTGDQQKAFETAVAGTQRGLELQSEFITAVGHMRQGHAWSLAKDETGYREATRCYREAIQLSDKLDVPRLKVEAFWGLCQAYGFRGDLEAALQAATQGIELAHQAGDEWIEASIHTVMGAGYALVGRYAEAAPWLAHGVTAFRECADTYGEAVARLWSGLVWHATNDTARLERDVTNLLKLCEENSYDYLFQRRTLLGPPDIHTLIPLLIFAKNGRNSYAEHLLIQLGLPDLELHPGYQLRIQTLGTFQLWRGPQEVPARAWQRKKAQQLFLLLLTHRGRLLHREQICEMLWPELNPEEATRDFKIAYNALCDVLEPARKRHAPSAYVIRNDVQYGFRTQADVWIDAAEFAELVQEAEKIERRDVETAVSHYQRALSLYRGDYLHEFAYQDWCFQEQERLQALYLRASEQLAYLHSTQRNWEAVIAVCQNILSHDDCWEQAYRLLMTAYTHLGDRPQALRTYERCLHSLQKKLGVQPTPATTHLYETIRATEK